MFCTSQLDIYWLFSQHGSWAWFWLFFINWLRLVSLVWYKQDSGSVLFFLFCFFLFLCAWWRNQTIPSHLAQKKSVWYIHSHNRWLGSWSSNTSIWLMEGFSAAAAKSLDIFHYITRGKHENTSCTGRIGWHCSFISCSQNQVMWRG